MTLFEHHQALTKQGILPAYTLYERPRDFPTQYVVRCTFIGPGLLKPAAIGCVYASVAEARADYDPWLHWIPRDPNDDGPIVGLWV